MLDIKSTIIQKLHDTENTHGVKIPLAIESGSRAWGFASPDSDYDCRFVYVHQPDWYLSVLEKKDFIEYAVDSTYDISGWDLRKAMKLIIKSNAVILEWLSSKEIYMMNEIAAGQLLDLAADFFNPLSVCHHYLSIARNYVERITSSDTAKLKSYFYVLRPLANITYIRQHGKMSYMEYGKTLSEIEMDSSILTIINDLLELKKESDESYKINQNSVLLNYFLNEIEKSESWLNDFRFTKNNNYEKADIVFRTILEEVWR
jgi:predicted nucleotidyltransferase